MNLFVPVTQIANNKRWRREERRGERREMGCKFTVNLNKKIEKLYERNKWTMY